ncbi:beta/gamma crystallin-related protein [Caulobacter sp. NIBR2454]|uniref:beta/gamma crystallin-related protein n=1 Tax=Caulobacter sp. NIBR2454 TaxID=3015996 RepID=UPI0022B68EDF|nr:beta/gamma crystallin-related protein [Caulobacter sp. NIBR2454]
MKRLILAAGLLALAAPAAHALPKPNLPDFGAIPGRIFPKKEERRLILFDGEHYTGHAVVIRTAESNLTRLKMNDRAKSARIVGQWRLCEDSRLRGKCEIVSADIPDLAAAGLPAVSSAAFVRGSGQPRPAKVAPVLTFYSAPDFQGEVLALNRKAGRLAKQDFNDKAMSARAVGLWRVCEDDNYGGRCQTVEGEIRNLGTLRGRVSSARPGR